MSAPESLLGTKFLKGLSTEKCLEQAHAWLSKVKMLCTAEDFSGASTYIRQILRSVDGPTPVQIFGQSTRYDNVQMFQEIRSDVVQIIQEILPKLYSKSLMVLAKDEAWLIHILMLFTVGPADVQNDGELYDRWYYIMDQRSPLWISLDWTTLPLYLSDSKYLTLVRQSQTL
ncbi:MAG: hypothetical protein Q9173_002397 [Seirophora scorigena]